MAEPAELPVYGSGEGVDEMAAIAEEANVQVALTAMANEFGAASARRVNSADQLSGDSQRMWAIAMTTPTVLAGMGFRVAQQSGGWPAKTGTGTGE